MNEDANQLIVLVYHNITDDNQESGGSSLTIRDFSEQMAYLYDNNYRTVGIEEFLTFHKQRKFPEKSIMITFDDGYQSFFSSAYPVLKKYHFKAVIFPIVGMTPGLEKDTVFNQHLTFHEMRLMDKESGLVDIGSHSYDLHYYREDGQLAIKQQKDEDLSTYKSRIEKDLRVSKDILELQTGQEIIALAWPYGKANKTAVRAAQELDYKLLFTLRQEPVTPDTPLDSIPRYAVTSGSMDNFKEILSN